MRGWGEPLGMVGRPVLDAHFSPDGNQVITAAADGSVRIWPVDPLSVALRYRPSRGAALVRPR